jgi:hypothetical protein
MVLARDAQCSPACLARLTPGTALGVHAGKYFRLSVVGGPGCYQGRCRVFVTEAAAQMSRRAPTLTWTALSREWPTAAEAGLDALAEAMKRIDAL